MSRRPNKNPGMLKALRLIILRCGCEHAGRCGESTRPSLETQLSADKGDGKVTGRDANEWGGKGTVVFGLRHRTGEGNSYSYTGDHRGTRYKAFFNWTEKGTETAVKGRIRVSGYTGGGESSNKRRGKRREQQGSFRDTDHTPHGVMFLQA